METGPAQKKVSFACRISAYKRLWQKEEQTCLDGSEERLVSFPVLQGRSFTVAGGGGVAGGGEKKEEIEADRGEEKTGKKMVSFQLCILISFSSKNKIHIYL